MLAVWILIGFVLLFAIMAILPIRLELHYSVARGFRYRIGYAFFTVIDSENAKTHSLQKPADKPKRKPKSPSEKNTVSSLLAFLGLEDVSTAAKAKQALRENGLPETIRAVYAVVADLFARIRGLACRGVFRKFDLCITVGDTDAADAAIRYGQLSAAIYPLLTLLDSAMKFRNRNVNIRCDYESQTIDAQFDGLLCYRPCHVIGFACGLLWSKLRQTRKKEGNAS